MSDLFCNKYLLIILLTLGGMKEARGSSSYYENLEDIVFEEKQERPERDLLIRDKFFNSKIKRVNEMGVTEDVIYTKEDKSQISFAYLFTYEFNDFSKLGGFSISYYKKVNSTDDLWWGVDVRQFVARWDTLGQNRAEGTEVSPDAESELDRDDLDFFNIQMFSAGVTYRNRLFLTFLKLSPRVFETIKFNVTYSTAYDIENDLSYSGPGILTEYSLLNRSGNTFYYGFRLSYFISSLSRAAESDETLSERSISIGTLNFGLEIGYFYN